MKDVRAIDMHHDAGLCVPLGMAVAPRMIAGIDDGDPVPGLGQMTADHRAGQARADHQEIALCHGRTPLRANLTLLKR